MNDINQLSIKPIDHNDTLNEFTCYALNQSLNSINYSKLKLVVKFIENNKKIKIEIKEYEIVLNEALARIPSVIKKNQAKAIQMISKPFIELIIKSPMKNLIKLGDRIEVYCKSNKNGKLKYISNES